MSLSSCRYCFCFINIIVIIVIIIIIIIIIFGRCCCSFFVRDGGWFKFTARRCKAIDELASGPKQNVTTKLCFQRQRRIDRAVKVDSSFVRLDLVVVVLMVCTDSECIHLEREDNDVTSYNHERQNNANSIPYCIIYPCDARLVDNEG